MKDILFCNLTVLHKNKEIVLKEVVYKETDGFYYKKRYFNEPVKVLNVDVIKVLGKENPRSGFKEVKKSTVQRNNITGAYE